MQRVGTGLPVLEGDDGELLQENTRRNSVTGKAEREIDDPREAVVAKKPRREVELFALRVFLLLVFAFGLVLLIFQHHTPVPQAGADRQSSHLKHPLPVHMQRAS